MYDSRGADVRFRVGIPQVFHSLSAGFPHHRWRDSPTERSVEASRRRIPTCRPMGDEGIRSSPPRPQIPKTGAQCPVEGGRRQGSIASPW